VLHVYNYHIGNYYATYNVSLTHVCLRLSTAHSPLCPWPRNSTLID